MILDTGGNRVRTKLRKDDLLVFNPERNVISIRRGNYWVIFPGNVRETPFPGNEDTFLCFANLLSYLIGSDPLLSEIEPNKFSIMVINEERCITYYV